jgi:hypothetical protein
MSAARVRVCVSGGLGNQLFQYAYAVALAERNDAAIDVDTRFCQRAGPGERYRHGLCALDFFPIRGQVHNPLPVTLLNRLRTRIADMRAQRVLDRGIQFDASLTPRVGPRWLIKGLMQSYRYFDAPALAARVKQELDPSAHLARLPDRARALVSATDACALHVRRGDYLAHPLLHLEGFERYLDRALKHFAGANFLVFSDDPAWCRAHFAAIGVRHQIVADHCPGLDALDDFALMSAAPRIAIANSTFSWWAAWLGRSDKSVVAPARWLSRDNPTMSDLIPPTWTLLDV